MPTNTPEALREVLALLEKATPGEWFPGHLCNDDHSCKCPFVFSSAQNGMGAIATIGTTDEEVASIDEAKANQAGIVAAVNLIRQHAPEIERAMRDIEALRRAGSLLANAAYNLAQDDKLSDSMRDALDLARRRWDAAIAAGGGEPGA